MTALRFAMQLFQRFKCILGGEKGLFQPQEPFLRGGLQKQGKWALTQADIQAYGCSDL